ncbi:MAG TPA: D-arabinono-1,4-lactone oxidase [Oligoflexus sp.]|uniref:D-arabinono-1,4-lactone oxidase n=1 Tax=Oligoflexus sp. TaxID=1971216 RepID=UPI002D7F9248|nr:D-arabinono-1,4-lactone oxidase [Oligoflexus sp.]HET9238946.1 D-arabinono-1,4-lactone oxidase [Oligoflexus sp.]
MAADVVFRNWSRLIQARPRETLRPQNLAELQSVVQKSHKVRVRGTGHSFNACVATPDTLLHSDALNRVLHLDPVKKQVKVEAGIKLKDLNLVLWQNGLAFPSLGDIAEQAMGGLVATGTHGTGLKWGSFCDGRSLIGMELVLADGSLLELRADREDDRLMLEAARLSLGTLGVIYSLSFQLEDAHHLEFSSRIVSQKEALDPALYKTHDHFEYFTFPFHDQVLMLTRDHCSKTCDRGRLGAWINDVVMENFVLASVLRLTSFWPSKIGSVMRLMTQLASEEHYVGRCYEVMASMRNVRFFEMEYAFPLERIEEALTIYHDVNRFHAQKTKGEAYYASFPGEVRFLGGDVGTMLSPTLGQPTSYLAVQVFPSFGSGYEGYFRTMEDEFRKIKGRPHWGKLFYKNPMDAYPRFHEWNKIRQSLDPGGKFLNPFADALVHGRDF